MVEIYLLLKKLFMMNHYDLADALGLSNFTLSLFRNSSLASVTISKQYFEYIFRSLFIIDGLTQFFREFKTLLQSC